LLERHLRERPDAEAVVDAANRAEFAHGVPRRLSWAALAEETERLCHVLLQQGLRRDDVVLVQLPNGVEQFAVYLACARMGFIVTPVPIQYREHELGHILSITQAAAVATFSRIGKPEGGHAAAAMFLGLQAGQPALRQVLAWGDAVPAGATDL